MCCSLFVVCSGSVRCLVDRRGGEALRDRALFVFPADHELESVRPRLSRCAPSPACAVLAFANLLLPRGVLAAGLADWPAASGIVLSHCISSSVTPGNSALTIGSQLALSYLLMSRIPTHPTYATAASSLSGQWHVRPPQVRFYTGHPSPTGARTNQHLSSAIQQLLQPHLSRVTPFPCSRLSQSSASPDHLPRWQRNQSLRPVSASRSPE